MVSIDSGEHRQRVLARRDALVEAHPNLVKFAAKSVARRMPPSIDYDDLIGEGSRALLRAATLYRDSEGVSFASYATHWVKGAMLDLFRRRNYIHATHLGLESAPEPPSVCIPIETVIDQGRLKRRVAEAMDELPERWRVVLEGLYGEQELAIGQIAARLGVTEGRVCQIRSSAIRRLKVRLRA